MTCKDCIHCEACERMISDTSKMFKALLSEILKMNCDIKYDSTNILSGAEICQCFQDRSRFVELPDYKYSAEERFRGAVQELIDIAKASETPSKILQATSESLAHFACELSKLEETKQTLKEREGK